LRGESNAGALRSQQAESRGSAQTKFFDGKTLVAGDSPYPHQTKKTP